MELYIYDEKINLLGVIDKFTSLRWRRKYYEPGEFELHMEASEELEELLSEGSIIHRIDRKESGIIRQLQIDGNDLCASGRMLSHEFQYHVVLGTYNFFSITAEQAMQKLVRDAVSRGGLWIDDALKVSNTLGDTTMVQKQVSNSQLLKVLSEIALEARIGYRVRLDPSAKACFFEIYRGVDRAPKVNTVGTTTPCVWFGDDFGNLTNGKYYYENSNCYTCAIVLGEARESGGRVTVIVDESDPEDHFRRELIVDARDLQRDEDISESQYQDLLRERGKQKLREHAISRFWEFDVVSTPNFEYLKDWDLGDIVGLKDEKRFVVGYVSQRITEIEEIYENSTERIIPTFGTPPPETFWIV